MTLTEAGRGLLVVVSEAIGRMEAATSALVDPKGPPLVVGVSLTLSAGWLAPRLTKFLSENPGVQLQIRSMIGRPEVPPRNAKLWIAFGQPPPGTESTLLFGETLVPVASPEIAASITTPDEMLKSVLIEVPDHQKNWAQLLGRDFLPEDTQTLNVDTSLAALSLASAGSGIALARPPATNDLTERFGLVPCLADLEHAGIEEYHILANSGQRLGAQAVAFRDWVVSEARKTDLTRYGR